MSHRLARGVLIAFEGIDGSGKSTQAEWTALVAEALFELVVVRTKEPTAGPWGQRLRDSQAHGRLSPTEELELFLRDRREHVETVIAPALAGGALVLVDRYYYSTAAYQGARGVAEPVELLRRNRVFAPRPDLVVLVDVPARVSLERIHGRGLGQDSFESLANLERCREIFLGIGEPHIRVVDGQRPPLAVLGEVLGALLGGPLRELVTPGAPAMARWAAFERALAVEAPAHEDRSALGAWLGGAIDAARRA